MTTMALVERALAAVYARQPALQVAAAVTGGGGAAAQLLFRPGSSSTMLQFSVPYARSSLLEFLDAKETETEIKFCSAETAERMAVAAWKKAVELSRKNEFEKTDVTSAINRFQNAVGVGCTAALATNYVKKGPHEAFVSVCRATASEENVVAPRCDTYHLTLDKTLGRSRLEEDDIVSNWLVYALAQTAAVDTQSCNDLFTELNGELRGQDALRVVPTKADETQDPLNPICGDSANTKLSSVCFLPHHDTVTEKKSVLITQDFEFRGIILPGSFNPLHVGHIDLAVAAQRKLKAVTGRELSIGFEMAVANADKGSIGTSTVMDRVRQFGPESAVGLGEWPVLVTNATLFGQKAELLRDCVFVIGADTAVRLVDKKYYKDDEHRIVLTLQRIADCGGSFIVAGRFDDKVSHSFISAESVLEHHIPQVFRHLFVPLTEQDYRNDISSTKLRQQAASKV